jgi:hypothetical protein
MVVKAGTVGKAIEYSSPLTLNLCHSDGGGAIPPDCARASKATSHNVQHKKKLRFGWAISIEIETI